MTMKLITQCRECYRRFDLTDETDADEWESGHDCEPTPSTSTAKCEKCGDQYEDGGWGDDGQCPRHRLS